MNYIAYPTTSALKRAIDVFVPKLAYVGPISENGGYHDYVTGFFSSNGDFHFSVTRVRPRQASLFFEKMEQELTQGNSPIFKVLNGAPCPPNNIALVAGNQTFE